MNERRRLLTVTHIVLALSVAVPDRALAQDNPVAIVGVRIIDGTGRAPIENATLLMRHGRVTAIGAAGTVTIPPGATTIDATGRTAIPGLIDAHVHLGATAAVQQREFRPEMLSAFLLNGVTTIRSMGDAWPWIGELRAQVARGAVRGPRIVAAGPILTAPGGHPAGTWLKQLPEAAAAMTSQVSDSSGAAEAVRRLSTEGVDLIKLVFDEGDTRSPFGIIPRLEVGAMYGALRRARQVGLPSAVHWANPAQLPLILEGRPDELEHVSIAPIADSLARRIAANGVAVTPTLSAFATFFPPAVMGLMRANVRRLAEAGVLLSAGSDAPLGPTFGGGVHDEMEQLVLAGLTPAQALTAATRNAALVLRLPELGTLEIGRRADIVLLERNPLDAIANTRSVWMVFSEGRVVSQKEER